MRLIESPGIINIGPEGVIQGDIRGFQRVASVRSSLRSQVMDTYVEGMSASRFVDNTFKRMIDATPHLKDSLLDRQKGVYEELYGVLPYFLKNYEAFVPLLRADDEERILCVFAGNEVLLGVEDVISSSIEANSTFKPVQCKISDDLTISTSTETLQQFEEKDIDLDYGYFERDGVVFASNGWNASQASLDSVDLLTTLGYEFDSANVGSYVFLESLDAGVGTFYPDSKSASIGSHPGFGCRLSPYLLMDICQTVLHEDTHGKQVNSGVKLTSLGREIDAYYQVLFFIKKNGLKILNLDEVGFSGYSYNRAVQAAEMNYDNVVRLALEFDFITHLYADHNIDAISKRNNEYALSHPEVAQKI